MRKKNWRWGIFHHINFVSFFPLFLQQPPPLCKYFNFAANKLLPKGMNLFLMLSRHIKRSNSIRIRMLCMQSGQNMNLLVGCCVFYGLDSSDAVEAEDAMKMAWKKAVIRRWRRWSWQTVLTASMSSVDGGNGVRDDYRWWWRCEMEMKWIWMKGEFRNNSGGPFSFF